MGRRFESCRAHHVSPCIFIGKALPKYGNPRGRRLDLGGVRGPVPRTCTGYCGSKAQGLFSVPERVIQSPGWPCQRTHPVPWRDLPAARSPLQPDKPEHSPGSARDMRRAIPPLAGHRRQQVLRLSRGYGRVNEHNAWIPRDFWLKPWEKEAIGTQKGE
jgi:hypothetical protein